jgi:hypothetical protein
MLGRARGGSLRGVVVTAAVEALDYSANERTN